MFQEKLNALDAEHLRRRLRNIESVHGPRIVVGGHAMLLMASNDYLGLAADARLKQAAHDAIEHYGIGSGASRLVSGTLTPHTRLERALAAFKGTEASITFHSGYAANVGTIPALLERSGLILADRLCHASLLDGCRLSGADLRLFHHNDMEHLGRLLARRRASRPTLIVTEGVFSMDGDVTPLPALVEMAAHYEAMVFVDDAHGTGVMGATGRGILEHFQIAQHLPFQMGTLSKALGASGGFAAGSTAFVEFLINRARTFLYSTAPPPAVAAAACAALEILISEPDRLTRLWRNRQYWHEGLQQRGFRSTATVSPIVPIILGDADVAVRFSERLLQLGVFAPAIRPPTVPKKTSRIRTTVTAAHTEADLDHALESVEAVGRALRVI